MDNNSKIARRADQFGHNMDFDHAIIVDKAADCRKRLFLTMRNIEVKEFFA